MPPAIVLSSPNLVNELLCSAYRPVMIKQAIGPQCGHGGRETAVWDTPSKKKGMPVTGPKRPPNMWRIRDSNP